MFRHIFQEEYVLYYAFISGSNVDLIIGANACLVFRLRT
jgi:hypothetical protein